MQTMPYIPEFKNYKERNRWLKNNAWYFTIIRRMNRRYLREERTDYDSAINLAKDLIEDDPDHRCLIYAVWSQHDALVATVSTEGVQEHD